MQTKKSAKLILTLLFIFLILFSNNIVKATSTLTLDIKENKTYLYVKSSKTIDVVANLDGKKINDVVFSYESNNPDVATVNAKTGKITGQKSGTATITVTGTCAKIKNPAKSSIKVYVREKKLNFKEFNNAPSISTSFNQNKYDNATILITSENGLKPENIHFYEATLKNGKNTYDSSKEITNKILVKEPAVTKKDGAKNTQYKYVISNSYLNQQTKKFYIKIKDNIGKEFNTYCRITNKKTHYEFDAAPRIAYWNANISGNEKKVSFVVKDYAGISSLEVYDYNNNNELKLTKTKLSSVNTLITLDMTQFKEKNGKYSLKIIATDNNSNDKQQASRLVNFSLHNLSNNNDSNDTSGSYTISKNNNMYYCYKNGNQNDKVTGLVKISGKTYYFSPKTETYNSIQHGTQTVTRKYQQRVGWVKINNDYYYFNPKYGKDGYMLTGTTKDEVTLGSDGKAKISSNQNDYINRKLMIMVRANDVVNAITNPDDTNNVKLRKCFNYVSGIPYSSYSSPIPLAGVTDYNYVENKEEAKFFDIEMAIYPLFSDKESIKSWANGSSVLSARESRRTVLIDAYGRRFGTNPKGGEVGDCFACSCAFAYLANAIGYTDVKVVFSIWQSHCWNSIGGQKYDVVNSPQVFGTQKENFSPAWTKDVSTGEIKRT